MQTPQALPGLLFATGAPTKPNYPYITLEPRHREGQIHYQTPRQIKSIPRDNLYSIGKQNIEK